MGNCIPQKYVTSNNKDIEDRGNVEPLSNTNKKEENHKVKARIYIRVESLRETQDELIFYKNINENDNHKRLPKYSCVLTFSQFDNKLELSGNRKQLDVVYNRQVCEHFY